MIPTPGELEDRRVQIYRDLIFKNVDNFIASSFPVFKKTSDIRYWQALISSFLTEHKAHSPYFSDLAREFLEYLESRATQELEEDPPYMFELAQYEWSEIGLLLADEQVPENCFEDQISMLVSGDCTVEQLMSDGELLEKVMQARPVLSPLAWPMQFSYAVHRISRDFTPKEAEDLPVFLIVYRNRHDRIQFIESNAITVRLLELCSQGEYTTLELVSQLAQEVSSMSSENLRGSAAQILLQLSARNIVGFSLS